MLPIPTGNPSNDWPPSVSDLEMTEKSDHDGRGRGQAPESLNIWWFAHGRAKKVAEKDSTVVGRRAGDEAYAVPSIGKGNYEPVAL